MVMSLWPRFVAHPVDDSRICRPTSTLWREKWNLYLKHKYLLNRSFIDVPSQQGI